MRSRSVLLGATLAVVGLLTACTGVPAESSDAPTTAPTAARTTTTTPAEPLGVLESVDVDFQGEPRRYDVYAPTGAVGDDPRPLVVVLPGSNMQPAAMRALTGFDLLADSADILVVYIAAGADGLDTRLCCGGLDGDVDFVREVLGAVSDRWPVDPSRIYAAGFSAGAAMTYKLAVRAPDLFAAVAPVSGGFYPDPSAPDSEMVVPPAPPSVITFTGSVDPDYDDILAGVDLWRLGADCAAPSEGEVEEAQGAIRSVATCADGGDVELYTVADLPHAWPGGPGGEGFGDSRSGLAATELIWEFFLAHPHR